METFWIEVQVVALVLQVKVVQNYIRLQVQVVALVLQVQVVQVVQNYIRVGSMMRLWLWRGATIHNVRRETPTACGSTKAICFC